MSSPVQESEVMPRAIEPRMPSMADIPFPRFPSHSGHHKDKGSRFLQKVEYVNVNLDSNLDYRRQWLQHRHKHSDECLFCRQSILLQC